MYFSLLHALAFLFDVLSVAVFVIRDRFVKKPTCLNLYPCVIKYSLCLCHCPSLSLSLALSESHGAVYPPALHLCQHYDIVCLEHVTREERQHQAIHKLSNDYINVIVIRSKYATDDSKLQ